MARDILDDGTQGNGGAGAGGITLGLLVIAAISFVLITAAMLWRSW